jgi:hypothetical protein
VVNAFEQGALQLSVAFEEVAAAEEFHGLETEEIAVLEFLKARAEQMAEAAEEASLAA